MRDTARVLWLFAVLIAGVMLGYTVDGTRDYRVLIATSEARLEAAYCRHEVATLNHHLRQQSRAMGYLLLTAGWMDTRPEPEEAGPWMWTTAGTP